MNVKGYELAPEFVGRAKVEYDQRKAFEGADFIYAKNWSAYSGDNYGKILCTDRDRRSDRKPAVTGYPRGSEPRRISPDHPEGNPRWPLTN